MNWRVKTHVGFDEKILSDLGNLVYNVPDKFYSTGVCGFFRNAMTGCFGVMLKVTLSKA